jgi:transcription termination/antitermination protein NusG
MIELTQVRFEEPVAIRNASLADYAEEVYLHRRWYAVYTRANHERHVADRLEGRSIDYFLPLYESVHKWKDRRVRLARPLFPGYVFVHLALRDRLSVLQIAGVVRFVGFNSPVALTDEELRTLRAGLSQNSAAMPHPFLTVGQRVRIQSGPFAGLVGILRRKKSKFRIVVSLELIQRSIAVEVDGADVVFLP